jgi:hypothetical protein
VWTHYGSVRSFRGLVLAILRFLPRVLPPKSMEDQRLLGSLAEHVAALHARTLDERIEFLSLLPRPFKEEDWGDFEADRVQRDWEVFGDQYFADLFVANVDFEDHRTTKRVMERVARFTGHPPKPRKEARHAT